MFWEGELGGQAEAVREGEGREGRRFRGWRGEESGSEKGGGVGGRRGGRDGCEIKAEGRVIMLNVWGGEAWRRGQVVDAEREEPP